MLYIKAVIDLNNPNALITLAHVSANANNPYKAFCEYIKYFVFTQSSDTIDISTIIDGVESEFGLKIPYNIMMYCLNNRELKDCIKLTKDQHQVCRTDTFDVEGFEKTRTEFRRIKDELLDALIEFVSKYGKEWTREYATNQLLKVLDKDGFAYDIFVNNTSSEALANDFDVEISAEQDEYFSDEDEVEIEQGDTTQQPLYTDCFFVGKFIQKLVSEDTYLKQHLVRICEGLMICIGTYQLPHSLTEVTRPRIRGTTFFFDTRLLLRYIGCAGEAAVSAASELVALIQNNGGHVCYYQHTLTEMNKAFDDAISSLTRGKVPYDNEMRLYAKSAKNDIQVLSLKRKGLVQSLEKSNIFLRKPETYSDLELVKFGFDINDLKQYMFSQLKWNHQTIENDALSIWETHMRRQGDYHEYCGTKQNLCVFVTSNSRLVSIALGYKDIRPNTVGVRGWKNNRLPIITDIKLTCRLWSPSDSGIDLPLLNLAANAVAAQRPTQAYINRVRELAEQFSAQTPEYADIPLPEFFDDISDSVFEKTQGRDERLNIGVLASSVEELAEMKARDQEKITNQVIKERNQISRKYDDQTSEIIDGAVESYKDMLGIWTFPLWVAVNCSWIAALVFAGISALISYIVSNWTYLLAVPVLIIVAVFGEVSKFNFIKKKLISCLLPKAEIYFEKKVTSKLRIAEKPYKNQIITKSKDSNPLIAKCRALLRSEN